MVCGKQSGLLWALQILKIFVGIFGMSDKINELHPSPRGVTCHVSVTTVVFIPTYYLIIISICTCTMLQIDNVNSDCSPQVPITKCRSIRQKPSPTFWSPWPSRWAVNTRKLSTYCHPSTRNYYRNISRLVAISPVCSPRDPADRWWCAGEQADHPARGGRGRQLHARPGGSRGGRQQGRQ